MKTKKKSGGKNCRHRDLDQGYVYYIIHTIYTIHKTREVDDRSFA